MEDEEFYDDTKVLFQEDDIVRILRGKLEAEDDFFVTIKRRDGIFRIGKKYIIKIERLNHDGVSHP